MKEVYLVIRYDVFPFFILWKMYDNGEEYQLVKDQRGQGVRKYDCDSIIRRVTKEKFEEILKRKRKLQGEYDAYKKVMKQEALEIAKNL